MTAFAELSELDAAEAIGVRRELVRATARRSLARRRAGGRAAVSLCVVAVAVALAPLVALVGYTAARGARVISVSFLANHTPIVPGIPGGGITNAIVGSLVIVGLASLFAVPVGIVAAVFLMERRGRIANAVRFAADVMAGIPSIAIGIFVYAALVEPLGQFSGIAGSLALATLMLPITIRASEAAMRDVPRDLWDAGLALGARRGRVVRSVVVRGALPGLVTGSLLAIARAVGETAPLLFTAFGSSLFGVNPLKPLANMPLLIYSDGTQAYPAAQQIAWGAALVLLVLVLVLSIIARIVASYLSRRAK